MLTSRFLLPITFIALCLSACENAPVVQQPSHLQQELTDSLVALSNEADFNGFGVAIVSDSGVLYQGGFGMADVDQHLPYTERTTQTVGSISKTVVGLAVMKAVELGQLELDAPVGRYLPFSVVNPFHPETPITVRHLVTHTSTITDTEDAYMQRSYVLSDTIGLKQNLEIDISPTQFSAPSTAVPMEDLMHRVLSADGAWYQRDVFLDQQPGSRFNYSNLGATLAALVVEKATGQAFDAFTKRYILEPLGMRASTWNVEAMDRTTMSQLYRTRNEPFPRYRLITYPDGGFVTSAADMAVYMAELAKGFHGRGTILSKASYAEFFRAQLNETHFTERNTRPNSDEYNMGILIGFNPSGAFGHTGGDPGVSSMFFVDPQTGTGRYLIVNTDLQDGAHFRKAWELLGRYAVRMKSK
jgi:CubicO group peptidase (beta-lactamase class C family)